MFRPEIKVIDCSVRDGGLMNKWQFDDAFVRKVYTAWSAGAAMVKVFPCRPFGPQYIRELSGPYDQIPLVAVGGVDSDNIKEYFDAGVRAVGVSNSLFGREALMNKDVTGIAQNVNNFIALCSECNK